MLYVKFLVILFNIAYILIHFLYTLIKCYKLNSSIFRYEKKNYWRGGRVWLNALVLKTSKGLRPSGVRIPPPPHLNLEVPPR